MRMTMVCLTLFFSCLAVGGAQDEAAKKALAALQGTWKLVSLIERGKPAPAELVATFTVTFKGDEMIESMEISGKAMVKSGKVKLDPTQKPAAIDFTEDRPLGEAELGIYELDGDNLKICMGGFRGARPKTFDSPKEGKGSSNQLMVLKRDKK